MLPWSLALWGAFIAGFVLPNYSLLAARLFTGIGAIVLAGLVLAEVVSGVHAGYTRGTRLPIEGQGEDGQAAIDMHTATGTNSVQLLTNTPMGPIRCRPFKRDFRESQLVPFGLSCLDSQFAVSGYLTMASSPAMQCRPIVKVHRAILESNRVHELQMTFPCSILPQIMSGDPEPHHISTSLVERQNLTMRMQMRRFTRRTNPFSKRAEGLVAALWLFVRIHGRLRVTPAMESGITDHVWDLSELIAAS